METDKTKVGNVAFNQGLLDTNEDEVIEGNVAAAAARWDAIFASDAIAAVVPAVHAVPAVPTAIAAVLLAVPAAIEPVGPPLEPVVVAVVPVNPHRELVAIGTICCLQGVFTLKPTTWIQLSDTLIKRKSYTQFALVRIRVFRAFWVDMAANTKVQDHPDPLEQGHLCPPSLIGSSTPTLDSAEIALHRLWL